MALRIGKLLRGLFAPRPRRPPPAPADPRMAADAWLGGIFARLGERYGLGPDAPDGARVLRRTGRARFNPMPVWLRSADHAVRADYEVRGEPAAAKALLDERVGARLPALGLSQAAESVEEWAGTVLVRSYQGRFDSAEQAAAAVRFICEESETQLNLAAE
jgi:hypothetical protein